MPTAPIPVALVTGASSGIGLAVARLLANNGGKIALNARSSEKLEEVATELPGSAAFPADMSDEFAIREMVEKVQAKFGRIDVLVNNAGRGMHAAGRRNVGRDRPPGRSAG